MFYHCEKNALRKSTYFGSQFQRFQSLVTCPLSMMYYGMTVHHGREYLGNKTVHLMAARKQREKGQESQYPLKACPH
jgi:hypothetical protein